jgi:aminoglycoside 3-N-acetyltransferase
MRTFGHVEGGADTVVDALLEVLGPSGTLVVPAFTFYHEAEDDPIIDPGNDCSTMGAITEAARRRPEALRSTAYRHSIASIGPRAHVITDTDPSLSPFDLRSSFGVMAALDAQVLLCGVTYSSSTSHHFAEWVCDVPYRETITKHVMLRRPDGSTVPQTMLDYQPKSEGGSYYGSRGPDFHRLGRMLEDAGRVGTSFIGNGAVRRFAMRDLIDLAQVEAAKDFNVFRTPDGEAHQLTPLSFGAVVESPQLGDGSGRHYSIEWCVKDPATLSMRPPTR